VNTITPSALKKAIKGKKVLIDTNIIIYLTDSVKPYEHLSRLVFNLIEAGEVYGLFSAVSIAEVMQGPLKKGLNDKAADVKKYLLNFPNSFCQMIDSEVLEQIGINNQIKWQKLRTIDSLIVASALNNSADKIVSNDLHFKKALPKDQIVYFDRT